MKWTNGDQWKSYMHAVSICIWWRTRVWYVAVTLWNFSIFIIISIWGILYYFWYCTFASCVDCFQRWPAVDFIAHFCHWQSVRNHFRFPISYYKHEYSMVYWRTSVKCSQNRHVHFNSRLNEVCVLPSSPKMPCADLRNVLISLCYRLPNSDRFGLFSGTVKNVANCNVMTEDSSRYTVFLSFFFIRPMQAHRHRVTLCLQLEYE